MSDKGYTDFNMEKPKYDIREVFIPVISPYSNQMDFSFSLPIDFELLSISILNGMPILSFLSDCNEEREEKIYFKQLICTSNVPVPMNIIKYIGNYPNKDNKLVYVFQVFE